MFYKTSRIASSPGFRVLSPGLSFPGLVLHYVELTKVEIRFLTKIRHKTAIECLTAFKISSDTTWPVCVHNRHCDTVLAVTDRLIGSPQKIGFVLGLACLVLCCETRSCHTRRHNDREGHSNFSSTIVFFYSVLGTSLLWRSTVAFTYLKVKSTNCLCLLPVVLVLLFWSWSWS